MTIEAIIVDDEKANIENLQRILNTYCSRIHIAAVSETVEQAVFLIQEHRPDLLFLDIQMGKSSGFDLLHLLPDRGFEVIFITAYDQYGIQAVKFAALDYILKPIEVSELRVAIEKAEQKIKEKKNNDQLEFLLDFIQKKEQKPARIALPQLKETRYVTIDEIIYCQAENTYTYFHLQKDENILVTKTLRFYADLLKEHGFLRPHQSFLVHPDYVKSWLREDGGSLLLKDGTKIPVSKPNRSLIKKALKE